MIIIMAIGQVIHRHRYSSPLIVLSFLESIVCLGLAASDLHVLSFQSLNALPMCVHYTSGSLSVARLSLAYWQNTSDMCYQVESDIICSQNGRLSKQWAIAKH